MERYEFPEFIHNTIDSDIKDYLDFHPAFIALHLWFRKKGISSDIGWFEDGSRNLRVGNPEETPKIGIYRFSEEHSIDLILSRYEETPEFEAVIRAISEDFSGRIFQSTDENGNKTIFYSDSGDIEGEAILSLIPFMLDCDMSEYDEKYLHALHMGNYTRLQRYVLEMYKAEIREKELKIVKDNPDFGKNSQLRSLNAEIEKQKNNLQGLYAAIAQQEKEIKRLQYEVFTVRYLGDDSQLYDYLLRREDIHVVSIANNRMTFQVESFIDMFESDVIETYIDNERFIAKVKPVAKTNEQVKALMKAIFVDQTYKIKGNATFILTPDDVRIDRVNYKQLPGYMNPHYSYHGCLGDNRTIISQCLKRGDIVAAIEMCCAASRVINPLEVEITFARFVNDILCNDTKPYLYKDGVLYTNKDVLNELQNQTNNEQEQEAENVGQSENDGYDD